MQYPGSWTRSPPSFHPHCPEREQRIRETACAAQDCTAPTQQSWGRRWSLTLSMQALHIAFFFFSQSQKKIKYRELGLWNVLVNRRCTSQFVTSTILTKSQVDLGKFPGERPLSRVLTENPLNLTAPCLAHRR